MVGVEAGDSVRARVIEGWYYASAARFHTGAVASKRAAHGNRWLQGCRSPTRLACTPLTRHRGKQALCVGVASTREQLNGRAGFHHAAAVHHKHTLCYMVNDCKVVAYEQQRKTTFGLQVQQQVENLRLN